MNQVLVIGGGPSYKKHYEDYKNFKGVIVVTDVAAYNIIEHGVYPDYIVTAEAARELSEKNFFHIEETRKHKTTIITSYFTRHELLEAFSKAKIPYKQFDYPEGHVVLPDVGLTAVVFAKEELKADSIVIVGFEHEGDEYPEFTFRTWIDRFWWFVWKWPDEIIINCSEGGKLYGTSKRKSIRKSTLKEINSK